MFQLVCPLLKFASAVVVTWSSVAISVWLPALLAPYLSVIRMAVLDVERAQASLDSFYQVENVYLAKQLLLLPLILPPLTLQAQHQLWVVHRQVEVEAPVPPQKTLILSKSLQLHLNHKFLQLMNPLLLYLLKCNLL